ncbi:unnamed protein product [Gongylonema pulchrum]|uniref:Secreted protein n=1 Tax=Gongylonema pulchrum TaxID=637853 RepID=A0A183DUL9_9BILA|nr:unnamed protein product [Gongylonema pulchrum]
MCSSNGSTARANIHFVGCLLMSIPFCVTICYLRCLGRYDSPNYFYLATLLRDAKRRANGYLPLLRQPASDDDIERVDRLSQLELLYD